MPGRELQKLAGAGDVDAGPGREVGAGVVARLEGSADRAVDVERADLEDATAAKELGQRGLDGVDELELPVMGRVGRFRR